MGCGFSKWWWYYQEDSLLKQQQADGSQQGDKLIKASYSTSQTSGDTGQDASTSPSSTVDSQQVHLEGLNHARLEPFNADSAPEMQPAQLLAYLDPSLPTEVKLAVVQELQSRLRLSNSNDAKARLHVLTSLVAGQPGQPPAVQKLVQLLSVSDDVLQYEALKVLSEAMFHSSGQHVTRVLLDMPSNVLEQLLQFMQDSNRRDSQQLAADTVRTMSQKDPKRVLSANTTVSVWQVIVNVLGSEKPSQMSKWHAAKALKELAVCDLNHRGDAARGTEEVQAAIPHLIAMLDTDRTVATDALAALALHHPENQSIIGEATLEDGKLRLLERTACVRNWDAAVNVLAALCEDHAANQSCLLHQEDFLEQLLDFLRAGQRESQSLEGLISVLVSQKQGGSPDLALRLVYHPTAMLTLVVTVYHAVNGEISSRLVCEIARADMEKALSFQGCRPVIEHLLSCGAYPAASLLAVPRRHSHSQSHRSDSQASSRRSSGSQPTCPRSTGAQTSSARSTSSAPTSPHSTGSQASSTHSTGPQPSSSQGSSQRSAVSPSASAPSSPRGTAQRHSSPQRVVTRLQSAGTRSGVSRLSYASSPSSPAVSQPASPRFASSQPSSPRVRY